MDQYQPVDEDGSHLLVDLGLSAHVVGVRVQLSLCVCVEWRL